MGLQALLQGIHYTVNENKAKRFLDLEVSTTIQIHSGNTPGESSVTEIQIPTCLFNLKFQWTFKLFINRINKMRTSVKNCRNKKKSLGIPSRNQKATLALIKNRVHFVPGI